MVKTVAFERELRACPCDLETAWGQGFSSGPLHSKNAAFCVCIIEPTKAFKKMPASVKPGVVTGQALVDLLNYAKDQKSAYDKPGDPHNIAATSRDSKLIYLDIAITVASQNHH